MKTPKKYIWIFLMSVVICLVASIVTSAKLYTGQEENYSWSIELNTGHMEITGIGKMPDVDNYKQLPYSKFLPLIKTLTIGQGITSIGSSAFEFAYNLESVTLPEGLVSIGDGAFESCNNLESINIPSSVTSIGKMAFLSCEKLDGITLPDDLENLGEYAFCECTSLSEINIPDGLSEIPAGAFSGCKGLVTVKGMENVETLNEASFYGCEKLNFEEFPESIKYVSARSFFGCESLDVQLPETIVSKNGAFYKTTVFFSVVWEICGKTEVSKVKINETPQYSGEPKKDSVIDGIYLFNGWNKTLSPAVDTGISYSATFRLASPIVSANYMVKDGIVSAVANLELSDVNCDEMYVLFACYGEDGSLIGSSRQKVSKTDTEAMADIHLRGRTASLVKAFVYTDKNYLTPLGESVTATLNN